MKGAYVWFRGTAELNASKKVTFVAVALGQVGVAFVFEGIVLRAAIASVKASS
jgi:hypothetical protein